MARRVSHWRGLIAVWHKRSNIWRGEIREPGLHEFRIVYTEVAISAANQVKLG